MAMLTFAFFLQEKSSNCKWAADTFIPESVISQLLSVFLVELCWNSGCYKQ